MNEILSESESELKVKQIASCPFLEIFEFFCITLIKEKKQVLIDDDTSKDPINWFRKQGCHHNNLRNEKEILMFFSQHLQVELFTQQYPR